MSTCSVLYVCVALVLSLVARLELIEGRGWVPKSATTRGKMHERVQVGGKSSRGTASTTTIKRLFRRLPPTTTIMAPSTAVPPPSELPASSLRDSGDKEKRLVWCLLVVGGAGLGLILILSGITLLWHRYKLKTSDKVKLRRPSLHHPQGGARLLPEGQAALEVEEFSGHHLGTASANRSPTVSRNVASVVSWGSEFDSLYTKENVYNNDPPVGGLPHLPPRQPRNPLVGLLQALRDTKGNNSDSVKYQVSEVSNQRVPEGSPSFRNKTLPSNRLGAGSPMFQADQAPAFRISEHSDTTARGHLYANASHLQHADTYVNICPMQSSLNGQWRNSKAANEIYTDVKECFHKTNRPR